MSVSAWKNKLYAPGDSINCKECLYGNICSVARNNNYKLGMCVQFKKEKPKTNADRIRNMTVEELAEFLDYVTAVRIPWCADRNCPEEDICVKCALEWLKQQSET